MKRMGTIPNVELHGIPEETTTGHLKISVSVSADQESLVIRIPIEKIVYEFIHKKKTLNPYDILTIQEVRVFKLLYSGMVSKEIAARLYVSIRTVKHHLSSIYKKLGVKNARELLTLDIAREYANDNHELGQRERSNSSSARAVV